VWLKTVFALPMDENELEIYRQCTGPENPPSVAPSEVYTIVGQRGGKSFHISVSGRLHRLFRLL
jgi:hypothetical protein